MEKFLPGRTLRHSPAWPQDIQMSDLRTFTCLTWGPSLVWAGDTFLSWVHYLSDLRMFFTCSVDWTHSTYKAFKYLSCCRESAPARLHLLPPNTPTDVLVKHYPLKHNTDPGQLCKIMPKVGSNMLKLVTVLKPNLLESEWQMEAE